MAQLVERHLAKVEVAGSTPVARSCKSACQRLLSGCEGRTSELPLVGGFLQLQTPASAGIFEENLLSPQRKQSRPRPKAAVSTTTSTFAPAHGDHFVGGYSVMCRRNLSAAAEATAKVGVADLPVPGHCDILREDCLGVVPRAAQVPDDSPGEGV